MGPWSEPSSRKTRRPGSLNVAEWGLIGALTALCVLGALALWTSRYEIGSAAGLPARLDRFTGQVIGCVPGQGCVELVPAGLPALHNAVHKPPAVPEAPGANAQKEEQKEENAGNAESPGNTASAQAARPSR